MDVDWQELRLWLLAKAVHQVYRLNACKRLVPSRIAASIEHMQKGESMMNTTCIRVAALTALLGAGSAFAQSTSQAPKPETAKPAVAPQGMKAYVDPETGQLTSRPRSQEEAAALDSAFQEDYSKIQEIHKADGSTEWIFNGQVDTALVARKGEDGKIEMVCAEHGVVHESMNAPVIQGGRNDR